MQVPFLDLRREFEGSRSELEAAIARVLEERPVHSRARNWKRSKSSLRPISISHLRPGWARVRMPSVWRWRLREPFGPGGMMK